MPRPACLLASLAAALVVAHPPMQAAPATSASPQRVVLPDDVVPVAYRIDVTPHADAGTFEGRVEIDVDLRRPVRRIVLNAADLAVDRAAISGEAAAPRVVLDADAETLALDAGHVLPAGRRTLVLAYRGRIFDQASALFRLKYATPQGPATALFTQFEDTDARRFVACWDEPARKATFTLSATVPAGQMAVGNMPVAASEPVAGGLQHVHFATTPRMSSYLLFFGLGDFERVHRVVDGVDVGVVVKRGDTAHAAYALDAAASLLAWYDDWFGVKYPLPKLDMLGGPGDSATFGAMENWGALFYFERDLLVDPRLATEQDRQGVFLTVAHEMAHQWFGDLVTMAWWDDLWLNEGFATWMQAKAADALHPEWQPWLQELARRDRVMTLDARAGTHPVIPRIADIRTVAGAFDDITYGKGQQVLRTLEAHLGADAFRAGVRRYIAAHAYGNTVTDDLWRALDAGGGPPVTAMAHALTLQPGVPLVDVRDGGCRGGRSTLRLAQSQFAVDADPGAPRTWTVPVAIAAPAASAATAAEVRGRTPRRVELDGCSPAVVDAGQATYARVRYAPAQFEALVADVAHLAPADQLGLLADTRAFAEHPTPGGPSMSAWLDLLTRVPADADPVVLQGLSDQLVDLDQLHAGLPTQPAFRAFAREVLASAWVRLGGFAETTDAGDGNRARLRAALVEALGEFDDPAVLAEVDRRMDRFLDAPATLDGPLRHAVLRVAARHADAARWAALHDRARAAGSELERQQLYGLLGLARDPALRQRAFALALSGEPPATVSAVMLREAAPFHPRAVLDLLAADWDRVAPRVGHDAARSLLARDLGTGADPAMAGTLGNWVAHHPADARGGMEKSRAALRDRATIRAQRLPEADAWIAARAAH